VGKFRFGWWENSAISLRPLPAPCVMCLVCRHVRFPFCLGLLLCCLGRCVSRLLGGDVGKFHDFIAAVAVLLCVSCLVCVCVVYVFYIYVCVSGVDFWWRTWELSTISLRHLPLPLFVVCVVFGGIRWLVGGCGGKIPRFCCGGCRCTPSMHEPSALSGSK
jgi:hypothetical protein